MSTPEPVRSLEERYSSVSERGALEALFVAHYEQLYSFAYPYVRSRETAEELVQDVFCRLWARRATLRLGADAAGIDNVRAYLFRAVRNAALSWLRHHRLERRLQLELATDTTAPGMGAPRGAADSIVQTAELRAAVRRAVSALPEPYREVMTLRSQHQLSYPEIAAVLAIPLKTVETRVTRAFKALREALADLR